MPADIVDTLGSVLAESNAAVLPPRAQLAIQLSLVDVLICRGDLDPARKALEQIQADDRDQSGPIGDRWLALARASAERSHVTDELMEDALRRAAAYGCSEASTALAQHLQRLARWPEAVDVWRAAISARPSDPNSYLSLARVYERTDNPQAALATYLEMVAEIPTARTYLTIAPRLAGLMARLPEVPRSRRIRIA